MFSNKQIKILSMGTSERFGTYTLKQILILLFFFLYKMHWKTKLRWKISGDVQPVRKFQLSWNILLNSILKYKYVGFSSNVWK